MNHGSFLEMTASEKFFMVKILFLQFFFISSFLFHFFSFLIFILISFLCYPTVFFIIPFTKKENFSHLYNDP